MFVLLNAYFFSTGTFGQPEVDSVNSLAEKHQMTKVQAEVTKAVKYGKGTATRYAFKALTKDGRNLTAFVKKADWDAFKK